ncbi:hypothetical protein IQ230_00240 [Gloeocapsopsis crepidinum LEGE 06123]|uniref:Capsular polysaccharide synthesis protein n=1 Tax=Gloeocapsopsis crepidinum LEGE 06123 TaxID=588587 RepID=A0ABR9UKJ6_9CHRO|nr:capsular polysaccharide synthesis protein [Gloeocapsopsis crepidinum]MBE9188817.1 hypothetical protein [Gloeocapsopsis crepidinum LEGE 06123]
MLNKTIWLLWLQGWENVPWLVEQVAESWEINNPQWNIKHVTLDNIHKYVNDIDYIYDKSKNISPQHKADIIRLSLLKNYGGVWADATMLCMQPLSTWVEEAVKPAGLWMYHGHGAGMSGKNGPAIWLIISEKNSLMISKWKSACDEYWRNRTEADSYFWFDGLFRKLFESDVEFKNKWKLAPHLYSELKGQAHSLARHNRMMMITNNQDVKMILQEKPPYALKLWWKDWQSNFPDVNSPECKNSNGYYAIKMSKRNFIFKHEMACKCSIIFQVRIFILDMNYFLRQQLIMLIKMYVKKLYLKTQLVYSVLTNLN